MEREPNLPGLYELVVVDRANSARACAERLAMDGASEGTLVWVRKQTEGTGRNGKYWISGDRNLHCAVILRPEDPLPVCCQLSLVASLSTAQAITIVGEPMEELRLGWPDDIYLNRGKVAAAHLSGRIDAGGRVEWLVVSVNVNTFAEPSALGTAAASLRGEGFEVFDRVALLESFSREFLAWLNRWVNEGLGSVVRAWSWRGDWEGERSVDYGGRRYLGQFESLDDDGTLKLRTDEGIMSFGLTEFHSPEFQIASQGTNR
jgi:BirA family biotin operon repressor/biotin-[acetyl-CoA-carboxylase] ligase